MREKIKKTLQFGEVSIADIHLDPKSRDDIPQLLRGLQYIYATSSVREEVLSLLEKMIPEGIDKETGRPGMELWTIFVMGCLRLDLNIDYDRLHDLVNNHTTIRQMLGHPLWDEDYYHLQTIKDNVPLLTPELLDEINQVVVKAGHQLLKKTDEKLRGKCDSYVVETDVHYPTDTNLLFDALRVVIRLLVRLCEGWGLSDWIEGQNNLRKAKKLLRKIQRLRRSTSKDEKKRQAKEEEIIEVHEEYLKMVEEYLSKAAVTIHVLREQYAAGGRQLFEIEQFMEHCYRQLDQIRRRVIEGEKIPHDEKVFSVFEEHTEWVSKGKAGVPVELGLRVCVVEDQFGFILHHHVMQKETDDKIAVAIVKEIQKRFSNFRICSFDKGFYSPENRKELAELLDLSVLPKKGKLSLADQEIQNETAFVEAIKQHSAVESGINALEQHGLDRCPDQGIGGFKRYVSLGVVGRNIQKLGAILREHESQEGKRKNKLKKST
jgi:IS5 family transposase